MSNSHTKEDLTQLVQLGMAACMNGDVYHSKMMFEYLLEFDPNMRAAKLGLAFTKIVTDDFDNAIELLDELSEDDDTISLKVIAYSLQRNTTEAENLYNTIKNKDSSEALTAKQFLDYSYER